MGRFKRVPPWIIGFVLLGGLLIACGEKTAEPNATPTQSTVPARTSVPTVTLLPTATATPRPSPTVPAANTVIETEIEYVVTWEDVTIFGGPGGDYEQIGQVFGGQTARVTGVSTDGEWWRVICPDDTVGDCWVSADMELTQPTSSPASLETDAPSDDDALDWDVWSSLSPDGWWVAVGRAAFPVERSMQYYTQLQIVALEGLVEWTVVDEWSRLALGYTVPHPLRWSADGKRFYFTNRPVPDGCTKFVNGSDLLQVDLADGSVTEVVPSVGNVLSLSPDETKLVYVGYGDKGMVLRDLATGEERPLEFQRDPNTALGSIVWSPEGTALAFTIAKDFCGPPDQMTHAIFMLDLETEELNRLLDERQHLYTTVDWSEDGKLWLADQEGQYWWLDVESGDVMQLYPEEARITLTIPEPSIELRVPEGYGLLENKESNRRGSIVSFDFARPDGSESPYLYEIQFFDEASIREFTENCQAPCFFGDYPDLERYRGQKAAFETASGYRNFQLQRFGERDFFVSNHRCEGDECVIREYTTFLGDTKIDIWVLMGDASQVPASDQLFSAFEIEE